MESAKKMILIEPEVIERLKSDNASTKNLSRLDEEMHKVINTKIDDREKWPLYLQTLQRYLHFIGEDRKPLQIPILPFDEKENEIKETVKSEKAPDNEETSTETTYNGYTKSELLAFIPKTYKLRGELLIDILLKNKDKISWNEKGTVFVCNREVRKSNIVDLLSDILRPLKNSSPYGWEDFAHVLKDLSVPLSFIGNPKRATYIRVLSQSPANARTTKDVSKEAENSTPDYFSTPKLTSSGSKVKLAKKINWEKWTPY
ncbi:hypothetical protein O0L34_g15661 [Tuta absoluta]|nr:hypothetical protein O0L34_g15661 [Tuta absoluta]